MLVPLSSVSSTPVLVDVGLTEVLTGESSVGVGVVAALVVAGFDPAEEFRYGLDLVLEAHALGLQPGPFGVDDAADGFEPVALHGVFRGEDQPRRAVGDLRAVGGRDAAVLLPRTMQRPGFALTAQQRRNIRLMLYNAGVVSLVQLYKATVGKGGPSYSAFVRSFSATERALFRRVFLARIRYWHTEQKFAAFLSRPERTFYGGRK